jgi:hypothetical protein
MFAAGVCVCVYVFVCVYIIRGECVLVCLCILDYNQPEISPFSNQRKNEQTNQHTHNPQQQQQQQHINNQQHTYQQPTTQQSQGMTIPFLEVDLNACFEYGQAYVALSRATSLEHLAITQGKGGCCIKLRIMQSPSPNGFCAAIFLIHYCGGGGGRVQAFGHSEPQEGGGFLQRPRRSAGNQKESAKSAKSATTRPTATATATTSAITAATTTTSTAAKRMDVPRVWTRRHGG